jgi:HEAT repeat protein
MSLAADELFATALRSSFKGPDVEHEEHWDAVKALRQLGTDEVFERAVGLTRSDSVKERVLGADILARLGYPPEERREALVERSLPVLLELAEREGHPDVLESVGYALGHLELPEALPTLLRFAVHPDPGVRETAAWGLDLVIGEGAAPPAVVQTLIELTRDTEAEVRDWAACALAWLEDDSEPITEALIARLEDPDGDVRGEACRGLAMRQDPRALAAVQRELEGTPRWEALGAAEELADEQLLPALIALRDSGWAEDDRDEHFLAGAIEKCGGSTTARA